MSDVGSSTTAELLQYLHESLDSHFTAMREARTSLEPSSPVFALEHELSEEDLGLLMTTVRAAVASGLGAAPTMGGLPFVVYAAESGYAYVGGEYWQSFETQTPGWRSDHRYLIKSWLRSSPSSTAAPCRQAPLRPPTRSSPGRSRMPSCRSISSATSLGSFTSSAVP